MPTSADTPTHATQDTTQPQDQGTTASMQDQEEAILQQKQQVEMRVVGILQALQQNPQLGDINAFMQRLQAIDTAMQESAKPLQEQQDAVQKQIMDYKPGQQEDKKKSGLAGWIGAGVGGALLAIAASFLLRKQSKPIQYSALAAGGFAGGFFGSTLADKLSGGKKEEVKNTNAEQVIAAQQAIGKSMIGLMTEGIQALSGLCDEYEQQIQSRQQLPATDAMAAHQAAAFAAGANAPAMQEASPMASVPHQQIAPSMEMMHGNTPHASAASSNTPQPHLNDALADQSHRQTAGVGAPS